MFVCLESMGIGEFLGEDSNRLFNSRRKAIHCGIMRPACVIFSCVGARNLFDRSWKRDKGKIGREKEKLERKWQLEKIFFFFYVTDCPVDIPPLSIYRYYIITSHKSFDRRNSFAFFLFQSFIHLKNLKKFFPYILL